MREGRPSPRISLVSQPHRADVYKHACRRVGRQPSYDICMDLREHGALVVDLQLCRDIESVNLFLREAPSGVYQVVIYDGLLFFGSDPSYNLKIHAVERRMPFSVLQNQAEIRNLMAALSVFCSVRGTSVAVLELTGIPIGSRQEHELKTFCAPISAISRCLSSLPSLQRLHLAGCSLGDQGLALLLPQLIPGRRVGDAMTHGLPKLSHLSLARNGLRDTRLLAHFLEARIAAQRRRQAVPLCILDLSDNPNLGACYVGPRRPYSTSRPLRPLRGRPQTHGRRSQQFWRRRECEPKVVSREELPRILCQAIRAGLLVKTLRLRGMSLHRDDIRPFLELVSREVAHARAGFRRPFSLNEISLEGNPLEPEFSFAIAQALRQLTPSRPRIGIEETRTPPGIPATITRCQSEPRLPNELSASLSVANLLERNAVSDGEHQDEEDLDEQLSNPNFRQEIRQRFQEDLFFFSRVLGQSVSDVVTFAAPEDARKVAVAPAPRADAPREVRVRRQDHGNLGIAVNEIPDRGLECGFGPPIRPGAYMHSDSSLAEQEGDMSSARSGTSGMAPLTVAAISNGRILGGPGQRHAKLEILRSIFRSGPNIPVGHEILRSTLDLMSSDASLNTEETVQLLATRVAAIRALAEEYDDGDEEDNDEEMSEEDEEVHQRSGRHYGASVISQDVL